MTLKQWLTVGKVAVELAWDLVTGKLESKPTPRPDPAVERTRRIQAERYAEASRNAGRSQYCMACEGAARGIPRGVHTCR